MNTSVGNICGQLGKNLAPCHLPAPYGCRGSRESRGCEHFQIWEFMKTWNSNFLTLRKTCCKRVVVCENTKSHINSFYILLVDTCMGIFHALSISLNFTCLAFIGFYGKQASSVEKEHDTLTSSPSGCGPELTNWELEKMKRNTRA